MLGHKDQSFKAFEVTSTIFKMRAKMILIISGAIALLHSVITIAVSYILYRQGWGLVAKYIILSARAWQMPEFSVIKGAVGALLGKSLFIFILSSPVWFLFPAAFRYFSKKAKEQAADRYIRGAKLITPAELNEEINGAGETTKIKIGTVNFPVSAEVKHCFIIGRPGAGKTVGLSQILDNLKSRNSKGIVYDFKGDYLSKFYSPATDIIFNPLDRRGTGWTIFNEIKNIMDVDAIAASLIPEGFDADKYFNEAARDVFAGLLHYLYQSGKRTNKDIWETVTKENAAIAEILKNTKGGERGYKYIEDGSSKQALGVMSTLMQYVKSFEFMAAADGNFSVRDWLYNDKGGFIFVTNYSDIVDTLKPVLSLFIDLLGRKLLSMPDDYNRRIYILLDECGTLQRLSTLVNLLTLSRSKGGSCWLGIQDIGQLDKIYHQHTRQTILNATGTHINFCINDETTAEMLSKDIGDIEYSHIDESHSMGPAEMRDGISLSRKEKTKRLVMPAEFKNLKDLEFYIKIPNFHCTKSKLEYRPYETRHAAFEIREGLEMIETDTSDVVLPADADKQEKHKGLENKLKRLLQEKEQERV